MNRLNINLPTPLYTKLRDEASSPGPHHHRPRHSSARGLPSQASPYTISTKRIQ